MGEATHHVRQQWQRTTASASTAWASTSRGWSTSRDDRRAAPVQRRDLHPAAVSNRGYGILWDNTRCRASAGPSAVWRRSRDGDRRRRLDRTLTATVSRRLPAANVFGGRHQGRRAGRASGHRALASGLASRRGRRSPAPCAPGRAVKLRFRWKADIGVKIARFALTPPPAERADVALVRGRRRRRLLVHPRAGARSRDRGYRQITGDAPMMPRWAFGLWQCRERYRTGRGERRGPRTVSASAASPST
jgi:alpha-glucosidase (family GH31 glycosyl hydrolase)